MRKSSKTDNFVFIANCALNQERLTVISEINHHATRLHYFDVRRPFYNTNVEEN